MFSMHMLNENGKKEMAEFKSTLAEAVHEVSMKMPDGRDAAIFKTKIEEAVFFGAKAIASKAGNFDSVQEF